MTRERQIPKEWAETLAIACHRLQLDHFRHLPKSRRYAGIRTAISAPDFAKALENECADFGSGDALFEPEKALRYVSSQLFRYGRGAALEPAWAPRRSLGGRVAFVLEIRARPSALGPRNR